MLAHHGRGKREYLFKLFIIKDLYGGEGGIRTPDTLSGMPVFKTGAINRSATSPQSAGHLRLYVELSQFKECGRRKPPCASASTQTKSGSTRLPLPALERFRS